jgi:hypothetical protein
VDRPQIGALDKRTRRIGFREDLIEVVPGFRFELKQRGTFTDNRAPTPARFVSDWLILNSSPKTPISTWSSPPDALYCANACGVQITNMIKPRTAMTAHFMYTHFM